MKNLNTQKVITTKNDTVKPLKIKFKTQQFVSKCTFRPENFQDMLKNFSGIEKEVAYIFF